MANETQTNNDYGRVSPFRRFINRFKDNSGLSGVGEAAGQISNGLFSGYVNPQDVRELLVVYGTTRLGDGQGDGIAMNAVARTIEKKANTGYSTAEEVSLVKTLADSHSCQGDYAESISKSVCGLLQFASEKKLKVADLIQRIIELEQVPQGNFKGVDKLTEKVLASYSHQGSSGSTSL